MDSRPQASHNSLYAVNVIMDKRLGSVFVHKMWEQRGVGRSCMDPEELEPKKPTVDFLTQSLEEMSLAELEHRITLLTAEIERCENSIKSKEGSRDSAESFFKQ